MEAVWFVCDLKKMGDKQSKCTTSQEHDRIIHSFEWIIPDFLKYSSYRVGYYRTKKLVRTKTEGSFFLCAYPHGFDERTESYVSLWLRKECTRELAIRFSCCVVNSRDEELCKKSVKQNLALESFLGWSTFCRRDILLDAENGTLQEGSLVLRGRVEVFAQNAIPNAEIEEDPNNEVSLSELSEHFQWLLRDHHFSDFTMKVDNRKLHAHKALLCARSPVFQTMLVPKSQRSLQEKITEIEITDVTHEAMEVLMKFIYTGKLDYLSVTTAMDVYEAADKYDVNTLKNICSAMLSNNLLIENANRILVFAYRHSDSELEDSCCKFISKNLREMKGKQDWIDLMKNYPKLADKALFYHEPIEFLVSNVSKFVLFLQMLRLAWRR